MSIFGTKWCYCLLLHLALFILPTDSCSCMPQHSQTAFCTSDFVIRAKVMSNKTIYTKWLSPSTSNDGIEVEHQRTSEHRREPSEIRYALSIGRTFRASEVFKNITHKSLFTSANSAACGTQLEEKTAYLIMGKVFNGKARVTLCDSVIKWDDVPKRMRKLLVGTYSRNCDCKVRVCFNKPCMDRRENNTCAWSFVEDKKNCYNTNAACLVKGSNECKWDKPMHSLCSTVPSSQGGSAGQTGQSKYTQSITTSIAATTESARISSQKTTVETATTLNQSDKEYEQEMFYEK